MTYRLRTFLAALIALLILVAVIALAPRANATPDEHHIDVSWSTGVPSTVPLDEVGQHPGLWATPQTLDPHACGVWRQVDRYLIGETTDALLEGGFLYGPNNPAEALDYEHPFESTGQPWQYVKAPDCVIEEPPTETPAATPPPVDPPAVVTPPAPVTVPTVVEVHTATGAPMLASTGVSPGWGFLTALLLTVAGVTMVARARRRTRS